MHPPGLDSLPPNIRFIPDNTALLHAMESHVCVYSLSIQVLFFFVVSDPHRLPRQADGQCSVKAVLFLAQKIARCSKLHSINLHTSYIPETIVGFHLFCVTRSKNA